MDYGQIFEIIGRHHRFYADSLPMIASENITSKFVRRCYVSDLGHRYAEGKVGERYYQGCTFIDEIESIAISLTKELFEAEHANVQPISGVVANTAAFFALTKPGDRVMALSVPCGGHISHDTVSSAGIRGLRVSYYPFDNEAFEIDIDETRKLAMKEKPRLFILGSSLILFPQPVEEISEIANEIGARVVYDASHVLGLIAGRKFQQPMREGADVMTGSTHKTFFGPQRAVILSTGELADDIDRAVFPGVVSNHHLNTLAGYAISAIEMKLFGEDYADQVVRNAKRLAERLSELGVNVVGENRGFTESHQVAADVREFGGGAKVAEKLESAGIVLNKNLLPWDTLKDTANPSGIRMGVQELTRLGMKEGEMEEIAGIIHGVMTDRISAEKARERVRELKSEFSTIKYTFEEHPAYEFPDLC
ncbi:Glycine/serine hydroxymethyltransferase [Geoglobus ahangari]|uniref:Serine hydroxymethyltransferase n=1 Tax=Geoglobus ahangari TaxID=113653 RepID=A0A0F7IGS3_9EURY|nr:serine hydroxymethyltransferase [Geoglobus ahangari]AKG91862.1 Glycine/serine hydroxymethyltransferase [Geoglobus ahangari]